MQFCPKCGFKLPEESVKFCPNCGFDLEKDEQVSKDSLSIDEISPIQKEKPDKEKKKQSEEFHENQHEKNMEIGKDSTKNLEPKIKMITKYINTYKKIIIPIVIVIIVAIGGYKVYSNRDISVIDKATPKFEGYNGVGTLSYNEEGVSDIVLDTVLERSGFSNDQIQKVESNNTTFINQIKNDTNLYTKFADAHTLINKISYSFNKTSNLKNGDKVTFTVKSNDESSPIKNESKTFTVKGLKKSEGFTIDSVLKENPVTFTGFNGAGVSDFDKDIYDSNESNSSLSNDDKIVVRLSDDYISEMKSKGKVLTGNEEKTIKVTGLDKYSDISNIDDVIKQNTTLCKAEHKDYQSTPGSLFAMTTKYTITAVSTYIAPSTMTVNSNYYSSDDNSEKTGFDVVTIFKVDDTETQDEKSTTTTKYEGYGYSNIGYSSEKLDTNDLTTANKYSGYLLETDEEAIVADLQSENSAFIKIDK